MAADKGNRRSGTSLRKRLIVSALIGALPLILLGTLLLLDRYFSRRQLILKADLTQAQLAAVFTEGWVNSNQRALRSLASSGEVQHGTLADQQALVERQAHAQAEWSLVFITDANGKAIASSTGQLVDYADREYFQQAKRTGEPVTSNYLEGRVTRQPQVVFAYPILRNGQFVGVVAAGVSVAVAQEDFAALPKTEGTAIALWGGDRALIASSRTLPTGASRVLPPVSRFQQVFSGGQGTLMAPDPFTGEAALYGYAPVAGTSWVVTAGTPRDVALLPVARGMAIFTGVALLALGVAVLWSIYSAGIVARQVETLAGGAREIGAGHLTTRVSLPGGGELEDLAGSLNKMAADLAMTERLKSDFLSMVSHELKTPLTTIRSFIEILEAGLARPGEPRYAQLVASADRQARHLQDMIENLLSVARLEAGTLAVTPRPTALRPVVDNAVSLYAEEMHERGLTLTVQVPETICVLADPPKLMLVLSNLLDNALKYTQQGGITVDAITEGGEVVVRVTDTGSGLSPEVRAGLFERFQQTEPLMTRRTGGAGLGLLVVKALVEAHGGHVLVESEGSGRGSTFGFTLPLADPAQER